MQPSETNNVELQVQPETQPGYVPHSSASSDVLRICLKAIDTKKKNWTGLHLVDFADLTNNQTTCPSRMKRSHSPSPSSSSSSSHHEGARRGRGSAKRAAKEEKAGPGATAVVAAASAGTVLSGTVLSGPALFAQVTGFLHWKDAVALGAAGRGCRDACLENREAILGPVLAMLESPCQSNVHHSGCGRVCAPASKRECACGPHDDDYHPPEDQDLAILDPRYEDSYDSWPVPRRCGEMAHFLAFMVANVRPHLNNFEDYANPMNTPDVIRRVGEDLFFGVFIPESGILAATPVAPRWLSTSPWHRLPVPP